MSKVSVKPEVLSWARQRAGLAIEVLLSSFPNYEVWERGKASPTLKQLEKLAKKTLTPLGCFFLPEPPEDRLPIPDFRSVQDQVVRPLSPNLLETVQTMLRRQAWMREYLIEQGEEPLAFVAAAVLSEDPNQLAPRIREALGLSEDWANQAGTWTQALDRLRGAIENARILTAFNGVVGNNTHRKLNVEEFRGFVLVDEYAPLIFVNSADAKAAQMFTLAHELAHLWLGKGGVFNLRQLQPADNDVELFCNHVAAEFLVPANAFLAHWRNAKTWGSPSFKTLARHFKVSPLVTARRALDLTLIDKKEFLEFYRRYMEEEREKSSEQSDGGDFYATQNARVGRRFAEAVIRAAKEGRILYRDAYQLTGLSDKTFHEFAKKLGVEC